MGNQFEKTLNNNTIRQELAILIKDNKKNFFVVLTLCVFCSVLLTVVDFISTGVFFGKLGANTPTEIFDYYRELFVTTLQDISAGRFFYTALVKGTCFAMPLFVIMICEIVVHTKINHRIITSLICVSVTVLAFMIVTYLTGTILTLEYFDRLSESVVFANDIDMQHNFLVILQIFFLSLLWSWLWCASILLILNNCRYELRTILVILVVYLLPTSFNFPISIQTLFLEPAYYIVNQVLNVEYLLVSTVMNPLYYVGVMATTFIVIVVYAFYQEGLSYT